MAAGLCRAKVRAVVLTLERPTHVPSSGVAGTMWANRSGIQLATVRAIGLAWVLTLPAAMVLASGIFLAVHRLLP